MKHKYIDTSFQHRELVSLNSCSDIMIVDLGILLIHNITFHPCAALGLAHNSTILLLAILISSFGLHKSRSEHIANWEKIGCSPILSVHRNSPQSLDDFHSCLYSAKYAVETSGVKKSEV